MALDKLLWASLNETSTQPSETNAQGDGTTVEEPPAGTRWAGTAEFIIGSVLATLVGVLWVEVAATVYDDWCTSGEQCWPFVGYMFGYATIGAFTYPVMSWGCVNLISRIERCKQDPPSPSQQGTLSMARVLLGRTFALCSSIANSSAVYYLLTDLHYMLAAIPAAQIHQQPPPRNSHPEPKPGRSLTPRRGPGLGPGPGPSPGPRPGPKPGPGPGSGGGWQPNGPSVRPGPSASVLAGFAVPLLLLADLAIAVGFTMLATLVTCHLLRRRPGSASVGGVANSVAASIESSFATTLGPTTYY